MNASGQQFSTGVLWHAGVPKQFLKCAIPECSVRGTDLFSLRLSQEQTQKPSGLNESKLYLFCVRSAENIFLVATEFYFNN